MFDKYSHIVSFQQNKSRSKKYAGKKDIIALVITSGNSAKPLEFLEETFNHVAIFVNMPVAEPRSDCIAFGRNRVLTVNTLNVVENLICSILLRSKVFIGLKRINFIGILNSRNNVIISPR